jgi:periplasmic protein TonB
MTATYAARASRQSLILAIIAGFHVGAFVLIASGIVPPLLKIEPPQAPITVFLPPPAPIPIVAPTGQEAASVDPAPVPIPSLDIPLPETDPPLNHTMRDSVAPVAGTGPVVPAEANDPALRTPDRRLAALIDSCYPSAARRLGEEGRAVARVVIDATGRATAWTVEQSSGSSRLDAAMDCVIRRLEFVPGRRDGRAVEATVMLPIVFRLD